MHLDLAKYIPVSVTMETKDRYTPIFDHVIPSENIIAIGLLVLHWSGADLYMTRVRTANEKVNVYYTTRD